jgi:hypothetical protein
MKSKKKLFKDLEEINPVYFKGANLDHPKIGDETYGKESYIYIYCGKVEDRRPLEKQLEKRGHKVMSYYGPGSAKLEVRVSYFKGDNWDE